MFKNQVMWLRSTEFGHLPGIFEYLSIFSAQWIHTVDNVEIWMILMMLIFIFMGRKYKLKDFKHDNGLIWDLFSSKDWSYRSTQNIDSLLILPKSNPKLKVWIWINVYVYLKRVCSINNSVFWLWNLWNRSIHFILTIKIWPYGEHSRKCYKSIIQGMLVVLAYCDI